MIGDAVAALFLASICAVVAWALYCEERRK